MIRLYYLDFCLAFLFSISLVHSAWAQNIFQDNISLHCTQSTNKLTLQCDYHQTIPEPLLSISAKSGNTSLQIKEDHGYPRKDGITAILFVIDTSDPARQKVIEKNIAHIKIMLNSAKDYHHFGLVSFDKVLRNEAPIGSSKKQIIDAAEKLRAIGKTTELYRNMLKAIQLLGHIEADRKSIFLFSDGLAEDKAYYHRDVINAAQKSNVVITGIGYPRSVSQSVALQTLRRLSEETGGLFIEADNQFNLPQSFLNHPYDSIDNGGRISIDLSPTVTTATSRDIRINLTFETDTADTTVGITAASLYQPKEAKATLAIPAEAAVKTTIPPVKVITMQPQQQQKKSFDSWLWYGIPVSLIILLILTITTFFLVLRRQQFDSKTNDDAYSNFKPYAYLVIQDETNKRYPITQETWRIGRSKDNELTLRDNSISRRHAEIHRDKGDVFTIIDLESLNGVFVNNEKIDNYKLREGDIVEIGDVAMRFTLLSNEYQFEESTVMQQTKVPIAH